LRLVCRPPSIAEEALVEPSAEGEGYKANRRERVPEFDQVMKGIN